MMNEPPKAAGQDELCPICNRPKKEHRAEEVLACSRKMQEQDQKGGG